MEVIVFARTGKCVQVKERAAEHGGLLVTSTVPAHVKTYGLVFATRQELRERLPLPQLRAQRILGHPPHIVLCEPLEHAKSPLRSSYAGVLTRAARSASGANPTSARP
eukprot:8060497-Alexandrium_andersonii.AAC.1